MSLVFPNALAATTTNLGLAKGSFWFGLVCLGSAFTGLLLILADRGTWRGWPALAALLVIAAAGLVVRLPAGRRPAAVAAAAVASFAAICFYAAIVLPNLRGIDSSDSVFLSLPKIAIVVFGVIVARTYPGVTPVVVAWLIGEVPVAATSVVTGHGFAFDVPAFSCMAAMVLIIALLRVSRVRTRASEPLISLASREDRAAAQVARAEQMSSVMVHDTILNELAVVGAVAPGVLGDRARDQIRRSLAVRRAGTIGVSDAATALLGGDVATAVDEARADGLQVTVTGDVAALRTLHAGTSTALALAVRQCLANVAAHSGTDAAELTVIATDTDVCILVADSGVGFVEAEMHVDRLGLRHSVRGRIADVGGTVQVWSAPGAGTAVSMLVPRA